MSEREDKVEPVGGLVVEPEELKRSPLHEEPEPSDANIRVAGGVLVANVLFVLVNLVKTGDMPDGPPSFQVAYLFDALIGCSLLMGQRKLVPLALFRICLGGLFVTAMRIGADDVIGALLQAIYAGSLLLLLIGNPRPFRLRLGAALGGAILLLELWSVAFFQPVDGELLAVEGGVVTGRDYAYRYEVPSRYQLREDGAAKANNPDADTWVVDTSRDAHALVVCERAPDGEVFLPEVSRDVIVGNLVATGEKLSETPMLEKNGVHSSRVEVRSRQGGMTFRYIVDVHVIGARLCSVYGFTLDTTFAQAESDLRRILDSFRLEEPTPQAP